MTPGQGSQDDVPVGDSSRHGDRPMSQTAPHLLAAHEAPDGVTTEKMPSPWYGSTRYKVVD